MCVYIYYFFTLKMKVKKKVVEQTFWYNYDTKKKRNWRLFPQRAAFLVV